MADTDSPTSLHWTPFALSHSAYTVRVQTSHDSIPPIVLAVHHGAFNFDDYLTPDEADRLADALKAEAAKARA